MKKRVISLLFLLISVSAFCQVKDYVGIVRGNIPKEVNSALKDSKTEFNSKGYEEYSKFISEYLESCFGSGFVFVDEDGTNYVVTNLHVVSHAKTATFEIQSDDGKLEQYKDLYVYYVDDTVDVALLRFNGNKNPFKRGLDISTNELKDGDDVYTAGYPGFGDSPLWQLGTGSVTNARAYIDQLIDRNISHVIQHSAEIDGGNSGGPLLMKKDGASGGIGYEVVGINTWKAVKRQNTNFAIPASAVRKVIQDSKKEVDQDKALAKRKEEFKTIVKKSHKEDLLKKYISYEAAIQIGEQCFIDALNKTSGSEYEAIVNEFYASPIEGFRLAVAYKVINDYKLSKTIDDDFDWVLEQGVWRIKSPYTNKELNKSIKDYVGQTKNLALDVKTGVIFDLTEKRQNFITSVDFGFLWSGRVTVGIAYEPVKVENDIYHLSSLTFGVRFPFDVNAFKFCMFTKVGDILSTKPKNATTEYRNPDMFSEVGLSVGYRAFGYVYPGISISYINTTGIFTDYFSGHQINLNAGVSFAF